MAQQTIILPQSDYTTLKGGDKAWLPSPPVVIDEPLRASSSSLTALDLVRFHPARIMIIGFEHGDLSDLWESQGSITISTGALSLTLRPFDVPDTEEPYQWITPFTFDQFTAISAGPLTVVIDDGATPPPTYTPSLKIGGELVESLKIGSELVGILKIGSEIAYLAEGVANPLTDRMPSFASASLGVFSAPVGESVHITLPAATGGDGALSYSVSPELPAGLSLGISDLLISGTPTTAQAAQTYTLTVRDADGDTATATFTLEVVADYTLTAATASGWTGYWFANAGSIQDGGSYTFTRPDGSSSSVRQTMCQNRTAPMRFAMTGSGLGIAQFPPTITTESGGTSVTWTRPSSSFNVGQGSAANYTTDASAADVSSVFADGNSIAVTLGY